MPLYRYQLQHALTLHELVRIIRTPDSLVETAIELSHLRCVEVRLLRHHPTVVEAYTGTKLEQRPVNLRLMTSRWNIKLLQSSAQILSAMARSSSPMDLTP